MFIITLGDIVGLVVFVVCIVGVFIYKVFIEKQR